MHEDFNHFAFITFFFYSNEKLVGFMEISDNSSIKYLNVKSNGVFLEIKDNTTSRFNYKEKENTLQIEMENGNIKEESFYMSGNALIIQSISNGVVKKNKFIKESFSSINAKKESKGHLAQIVRRKNSTRIKPSGKIYKGQKKLKMIRLFLYKYFSLLTKVKKF